MPIGTSSYTWRTPTEPEATVFHAAELKHRRVHPSGELRHRLWVLDYNYTPGERVRVHSVSAPGVERPARGAHLYAPGVPYWEDVGREARLYHIDHKFPGMKMFYARTGVRYNDPIFAPWWEIANKYKLFALLDTGGG